MKKNDPKADEKAEKMVLYVNIGLVCLLIPMTVVGALFVPMLGMLVNLIQVRAARQPPPSIVLASARTS
jgi:hypothetical protein